MSARAPYTMKGGPRELAAAVVLQGIHDMTAHVDITSSVTSESGVAAIRQDGRDFLRNGEMRDFWCGMAGVDATAVGEMVKREEAEE